MKRTAFASSMVLAFVLFGGVAGASIPMPSAGDREASFLPPPVELTDQAGRVGKKAAVPDDEGIDPVIIEGPPPSSMPSVSVATPAPVSAPMVSPAIDLGKPVSSAPLPEVDPQTVGLMAPEQSGFGTAMWKGTTRVLIDRFLSGAVVPSGSPTINGLAHRLLVTTAALPELGGDGTAPARSLSSLRIEKLIALGFVSDAWKLASLLKGEIVDEPTLRLLAEASIVNPNSKDVCAKLPSLIATHAKPGEVGIEWQKSLLMCQLRDGDMRAAQLSYDMLREQQAKDDLFLSLISKNVLAGGKQLPRQLTPLRPLNLAVLRQLDVPLPPELYARPDVSMIPELLKARSADEKARLTLAEKAAAKGLLSVEQLAEIYASSPSTPNDLETAASGAEIGPRVRALIYQIMVHEESQQKKTELLSRFLAGMEEGALSGSVGSLIAGLIADVPVANDYAAFAPQAARLFALAGKNDKAKAWFKLAKSTTARTPEIGTQLASQWPLFVLSGFAADDNFADGLKEWLSVILAPGDVAKEKPRREAAGNALMLLAAAGVKVPEDAWLRVMDTPSPAKQMMPSPLLLERLGQAAEAGRKGEVVLLAMNLIGGGAAETPTIVIAEVVRALRQVGLDADAKALAREATAHLIAS